MNKILKTKLANVLKAELDTIWRSDNEMSEKIDMARDVLRVGQIVDNFDDLEPTLQKFFKEKREKEKWGER